MKYILAEKRGGPKGPQRTFLQSRGGPKGHTLRVAIVVEIVGNGLLILVVVFDIAFGLVHTSILFFRGGFKNP